jgi:Rrf2 family protein
MRLTRAGEYAVRCVLYLSALKNGVVASRKEIAREMDIPDQFLGKIAQQLSRAGFLEIVQGPKGGFRLLISPDKMSLLDVGEESTEGYPSREHFRQIFHGKGHRRGSCL